MQLQSKIASGAIILLLCCGAPWAKANSGPLITQYMFNKLAINPAFAGTEGALNAMVSSRHQWVGFDNAPSTQTFTIHTPVSPANFGLGLSLVHDNIGPLALTSTFMDYSYHLRLGRDLKLSLGLKGGFNYYHFNLTRYLEEVGTTDLAYSKPTQSMFLPNFGFGIYAWAPGFYIGLSVPMLIENQLNQEHEAHARTIWNEKRLYLLMAGYTFAINQYLALKPSFIVRASESAPVSSDLNLTLIIHDRFWTGAMVRPGAAMGMILKYKLTEQFSVGYAYDVNTNNLQGRFGNSHEVMVSFGMNFKREGVTNPRIF